MPQETMTPRERWLAVLTRHTPDRVPMDYWATPEFTDKLVRHLGCSSEREALEALHVDFVVSVHPRYVGPPLPEGTDMYGCRYRRVDYGTGSYDEVVYHPLAQYTSVEEIERSYTWPSVDWFDFGTIPEQLKGNERYPIRGGGSEPFLTYENLRGQEQAFIDLVLNPDIVHYCLDRLFSLAYEYTRRIYEQIPGQVTFSYVAEDMGGQTDLMFSPAQIHEFLLPRMKRMIDLVHEAGAFAFHHNDGNCRRIIPDMIEAGIDILNPIQWRAKGMERESLKRDFGDRLVFHGAMDNQYTLPFGTVEEVRQEVLDNLRILGEGGGYILAPCHNIQPLTPPENVVAMYETCFEHGWC
ncbi:MAG: uroporphyrinogen-III decarboxylase-like protein [Anaerolineae bacterium]|nr:uroporphyrinogen-III decarboxylase-like protein [Anaerolineae bacterium]